MKYLLAVLVLLVASTATAGDYYRTRPYSPYAYRAPQRSYYGQMNRTPYGTTWSVTPQRSLESIYNQKRRAWNGWGW